MRDPGEPRDPRSDPPEADSDRSDPSRSEGLPEGRTGPPPRWYFSWWGRARHFVYHNILHADDSPHRLALGVGIGMWIALLPLVGVQMVVSAILCHPVKGNKVVAMAMAWVSNPITLVPIFLPCYWLGCWILGLDAIPYEDFVAIFFPPEGGGWMARVQATWSAMMGIFGPLWLGCLIVATAVAIPTYFVAERGITWYRLRRYGTTDLTTLSGEGAGG
jgi:uncharacterized protein